MRPLLRLSEWELNRFADPFLTLPMFFGMFMYGCPTAYLLGLVLVEGYRPHTWIAFVLGGLVTVFCTYFIWLHTWCVRELKRREASDEDDTGEDRQFLVHWEMDISARTTKEAAEKALAVHRNPESIATVFDVFEDGHFKARVDLTEGTVTQ